MRRKLSASGLWEASDGQMADEEGGKKKRLGRGLAALIGEVGTEPPSDPRSRE